MSWATDPPFERGRTYFNGETISTPPTGEFLGGFNYEGQEFEWEDSQLPNGGYGTGLKVKCRVVRNSTGAAVLPGQMVSLNATSRVIDSGTVLPGTNADSIIRTTAAHGYPADEFLPTAGVPNGDLFYVVVSGPTLLKTSQATNGATLAVDQKVVSGTMAGTTSVDAGAIVGQSLAAPTDSTSTTNFANQVQNAIGRAMSACSSQGTGQSVLVCIGA